MNIEIKIGREVVGDNVIPIPSSYKKVSRFHATLYWRDGVVTLQDNESSNGTFVNGRRIAKTKLNESDVVILGGKSADEECFQLDVKVAFDAFRRTENANRIDYSKEFQAVKQAYMDYQHEVAELKRGITMKSQMPVRVISLIPTLVGAIIAVMPGANPSARIIAISVGGVITGIVNLLMMGRNTSSNEQLTEKVTEIQIKYQPRYTCPKCGMKYPFTTHWKKLQADGKCPNPKCNALFIVK